MNVEIVDTLKNCLGMALAAYRAHAHLLEPYEAWHRAGPGSWQSAFEDRPSFLQISVRTRDELISIGGEFTRVLLRHHPEYGGLAGPASGKRSNRIASPDHLIGSLVLNYWRRQNSFDADDSVVDAVVRDFSAFVDNPNIRLRAHAELYNFEMPRDEIALPRGIRIRRITEDEVSKLYGGFLWSGRGRALSGIPEFVLNTEFEDCMVFGDVAAPQSGALQDVRDLFNRAILAMRTFKMGRVGYSFVHLDSWPSNFLMMPSVGLGDLHVPFGVYHLNEAEITPFLTHAGYVFQTLPAALETACSRLADAESRSRPQDAIVDAVIGLEAILLASMEEEGRHGELRYRFSIHYSTFFFRPEARVDAFRTARRMYDLRSLIAHGGEVPAGLDAAAQEARDMLRMVVKTYLPCGNKTPYRDQPIWDRAYFGLT